MICPWDNWPRTALGFCENLLCAWIKQPGNTWSNIGYLIVALWIWNRAAKDGILNLRMLSLAAFITGMGSAFFHATGTSLAGNMDLLGMFLGTGALTALNLRRWRGLSWKFCWGVFLFVSFALLETALYFPGGERWIYALSGPCCWIELGLYIRDRSKIRYRYYLLAWITVGIAVLAWWMDIEQILCAPGNHFISGHAVWHLLSAAAFFFIYRFYLQFRSQFI